MSNPIRLAMAVTALAPGFPSLAGAKEPPHRGLLGTWHIEPSNSQYKGRAPPQGGTMQAADGQSFTAVSQRSAPGDGHLYTSTIVWKRVAGS